NVPTMDPEIIAMGRTAREDHPSSQAPIVLADGIAGLILPAAAVRVYAGHWAFTPEYTRKLAELILAGLQPGVAPGSRLSGAVASRLRELFDRIQPDYVLVRHEALAYQYVADDPRMRLVQRGVRNSLYAVSG